MTDREHPLPGQVLRNAEFLDYDEELHREPVADLAEAKILTSEVEGEPGRHKIVLDIDMPAKLIPSSTEGHYHLIIDHEISWPEYQRLLWVMADIELLEEGYVAASDKRGYSAVRLPWIKKGDEE